jgi:hypothetical protein
MLAQQKKRCLKSRLLQTLLNYGFEYNLASHYVNYDVRGGLRELNRIKKQIHDKK